VIDVVEDHRLPLGCDPAGEAATDRDPNATLDLFFDSYSRARNQLVGVMVDKEHGAGVRFEDVADPREQHREQVVELEVRERRIRDRLEVLDAPP
jgi:predicted HAD superfamily phosphohydrolase